jgi:hypothetical protein
MTFFVEVPCAIHVVTVGDVKNNHANVRRASIDSCINFGLPRFHI